jgi:chloramphenicol 3-O-phosphotransferase
VAAVLLLTGAPGTGKSSTLDALATLLEIDGVEYGAIEAEQLAWGLPWLSVAEAARQLDAVLSLQRRAGRRLFLVAAGLYSSEELRTVVAAVRAEPLLIVCLVAGAETVAARLAYRESDKWPGKADLIARARTLADAVPEVEGIDVVIDTERADVEQVAAQIRDAMRARGLL